MTSSLSVGRKKSTIWNSLTGREKRYISSIDLILPSFTRRPSLVTGTLQKCKNLLTFCVVDKRTTPSHRPCELHDGDPFGHVHGLHVHVQIHHVLGERQ